MKQMTEEELKFEYLKLANAYATQKDITSKKEEIRKDIQLLLDVLGFHIKNSSISESSTSEFVIDDEIDRLRITKKLLSKINKL